MKILVCIKQVPDTTEIKIDPVTKTLVREGVLTQIQTTAGFADRNKADIRMVQSFLERERLKISESYQQLLDFLKDLLQAQG